MNRASPTWVNAPNLVYPPRHGAMYSYGGYLYMLGGWTYDGCRSDHYRWLASGQNPSGKI